MGFHAQVVDARRGDRPPDRVTRPGEGEQRVVLGHQVGVGEPRAANRADAPPHDRVVQRVEARDPAFGQALVHDIGFSESDLRTGRRGVLDLHGDDSRAGGVAARRLLAGEGPVVDGLRLGRTLTAGSPEHRDYENDGDEHGTPHADHPFR
jgi:hypothetical protein